MDKYPPGYKGPFTKDDHKDDHKDDIEKDLIITDIDDPVYIEAVTKAWNTFIEKAVYKNTIINLSRQEEKRWADIKINHSQYDNRKKLNLESKNKNIVDETNRVINNIKNGIESSEEDKYYYDRTFSVDPSTIYYGTAKYRYDNVNKYGYPLIMAWRKSKKLLNEIYKKEGAV